MTLYRSICFGLTLILVSYFPAQCAELSVAITEFVAVDSSGIKDEEGDLSDWIELTNLGSKMQQLNGCYLTDNPKKLDKWKLADVSLEPGASLLVMASGKNRSDPKNELHTNFQLSAKGEFLGLVAADGKTVIHAFAKKYPAQKPNVSFGVIANKDSSKLQEGFFLSPTPGEPNGVPGMYGNAELSLSHARGIYDQPFELVLSSSLPGAIIRYSTNGSPPTEDVGTLYEGPIPIHRSTVLRVVVLRPKHPPTVVATHSFILPQQVVQQAPEGLPPEGFPYQWGRNRVDYGMDPKVTDSPEWRDQIVQGLTSIPSFSLVTDMNHLFDEEEGIYANPQRDGREWERPCSVEMIHPDGKQGFQIDCGVRVRGGFSRNPMNPKHAFRLFFRSEYGASKLKYRLFGKRGAKDFDNLDLRTFQNYSWSFSGDHRGIFLRDQFSRDLQLAMDQPAARGDFCHLYVNGHYWGLFDTCERPKAAFASSYLKGKKADFDVIKKGEGRGGVAFMATDGDTKAWRDQWVQAKSGLKSNDAYFKLMGQNPDGSRNESYPVLLDPENLIDYMLVIFYAGNFDAPVTKFAGNRYPNNWYGVRNRNGNEGFRYLAWDAEHTLLDVKEDRTGPFPAGNDYGSSNPQWIYQQCLNNAEFRLLVADRIHRHFFNGGVLSASAVANRFRNRAAEIETAVICESARWGDSTFGGKGFNPSQPPARVDKDGNRVTGPYGKHDWQREISRIVEDYFPHRSEVVLGQLYQHGVIPDIEPPVFSQHGGKLKQGESLTISAKDGAVYYTTDGSDPRAIGGDIAHAAQAYEQPLEFVRKTVINARARIDGDWSALTQATFKKP